MDKEMFRTIISENQEYIGSIPLVERPLDLEEHGNYVFVGVRQAGKSYLLYLAKTEHSHPLGMVVSTHFRCGKGVKRGLKNGALPFKID